MRLLLILLGFGCPLLAQMGESHVDAALVADHQSIVKGEPFLLGVHLEMEDHWHTYWENPGFSGLPTTLKLEDVDGLEVKPLQFSLPQRFVDEANFITYGYEDEALLIAEAVYQGDAAEIKLKGKVNWLECKELCIPGEENVSLTLKVGDKQVANEKLFAAFLPRVPKTYDASAPFRYGTEYQIEKETWKGKLTIRPSSELPWSEEPADFGFYPTGGTEFGELKKADLKMEDGNYIFDLYYEAFEENLPQDFALGGVLKLTTQSGVYAARLPLYPEPVSSGSAEGGSAAPAASKGGGLFWLMLLFAFLGGMILNLMPCVLPVLSLKVFSLIKDAGESARRRVQLAWVYTLGILTSFLALSLFFVAAKAAGGELGVGFQFQSPGFVVGISALIFVMALSFFGVFHFGSPNSQKLNELSMKSGYQGAFFNGILMTLLSTPCSAPFLGAAYGWALTQSNTVILLAFQVVAFGLAAPYLLLCYAPRLLKLLPKPGNWMNHFKVIMGFLLMATVVWLFSILTELTGRAGSVGLLTLLVGLGLAAWIYGQSAQLAAKGKGIVLTVAAAALACYLGLFKLWDIREPFADKLAVLENQRLEILSSQDAKGASNIIEELEAKVNSAEKTAWLPYSPTNLAHFRKQGRMVFLDFTAAWCLTCKANEKLVLDTKKIRTLFANEGIVAMKADYTHKDDHLTQILKSYQRASVPMYLVYPGQEDAILLPEVITKAIVIDAVEKARVQMARASSLEGDGAGAAVR